MSRVKVSIAIFALVPTLASCGRSFSVFSSQSEPQIKQRENELKAAIERCREQYLQSLSMMPQRPYGSCQQIEDHFEAVKDYNSCVSEAQICNDPVIHPGGAAATMAGSSASPESKTVPSDVNILTNVRHEGVDEGDFVKISDQQIFVGSQDKINVIDRKTKKHLGSLKLPDSAGNSADPTLLVTQNKLIVTKGKLLQIYEILENQPPHLRQQKTLAGQIVEVLLANNRIVIISKDRLPAENLLDLSGVKCTSFLPSTNTRVLSRTFTQIQSMPVEDLSQISSVSILGDNRLYMTENNIYLFEDNRRTQENTGIRKFSLNSRVPLTLAGYGEARGYNKDVWALSELPSGELAVASSSGNLFDGSALNHFVVLAEKSQKLEKTGETPDFGAKEDIRSVRFFGPKAYVVTFKKTDPLFAIDISTPNNPKIVGELKIPGFSNYMQPMSKDRLIGLGFDAKDMGDFAFFQGLQLSLFDISNPIELARKDVKILGTRGSSSLATDNHKAFFLDPSSGVVAFPVALKMSCNKGPDVCERFTFAVPPQLGAREKYTGAAVMRVQGNSFAEPQFISNSDLTPTDCVMKSPKLSWWLHQADTPDIQRIFKFDGELMSVSKFGLKTFRLADTIETLTSTQWSGDCQTSGLSRVGDM